MGSGGIADAMIMVTKRNAILGSASGRVNDLAVKGQEVVFTVIPRHASAAPAVRPR